MRERSLFWKRLWLNRKGYHENAYIAGSITTNESDKRLDVDATLSIADCSRTVHLDFCVYNYDKAEINNNLAKLDKLANTINGFRDAYIAAIEQKEQFHAEHRDA
jgi:uncharacterized YccA/Bax inhibitor family protein